MNNRLVVNVRLLARHLPGPESVPRRTVWVLVAFVAILSLTACGGTAPAGSVGQVETSEAPTVALATPTEAPTATMPPDTPTAAPTATDTPEPPTPTAPPAATDTPEPSQPTATPAEEEVPAGEEEQGRPYELPFLGSQDAPVTIVEFGEYL